MKDITIIERIKKKKLVLTVTTGRSGTAYLSTILGFVKGACALHEPTPEFVEVLRSAQHDQNMARQFLLEKKLPAILDIPTDIYIETSHLACKGFLEPLLEMNIVPDLIIHRRPARDVALSMLKMGTVPGRSNKGLRFYLSPGDPGVLELSGWDKVHDYQLCFWYCLEIERRAQKYKQIFSQHGARIAETSLAGLKTFSGLQQMVTDLGLSLSSPVWLTHIRFLRNSRIKVNESKETKKNVLLPNNLEELEREIREKTENGALTVF